MICAILVVWTTRRRNLQEEKFKQLLNLCLQGASQGVIAPILEANPEFIAKRDEEGWDCLINASKMGHVALVDFLLKLGAPTRTGLNLHSALRGAALNGHHECLKALLARHDVDPDVLSRARTTPLMGAAMKGDLEMTRLLLQAGANRQLINDYGETAHDLAVAKGFPHVAQLILTFPAD